ncbi:hypothetical protein BX600DRAFT_468494 [Xylariales sp. PMI_506]|nr:hypothetical protein BX600DRAFT_468494 [Xylariales sp. PMI_506]
MCPVRADALVKNQPLTCPASTPRPPTRLWPANPSPLLSGAASCAASFAILQPCGNPVPLPVEARLHCSTRGSANTTQRPLPTATSNCTMLTRCAGGRSEGPQQNTKV